MQSPENFIDTTLQATVPRLIIAPTNSPTISGKTVTENSDGTISVTLTWTYTQGITPASGFIVYVTKSLSIPTKNNSTAFYVPIDVNKLDFFNITVDSDFKAGIAAFIRINDVEYIGGIVSATSWELYSTTPVFKGDLYNHGTGTNIVIPDLVSHVNYSYNFSEGMLSDGDLVPYELTQLRKDWEHHLIEGQALAPAANALGVSYAAYSTAFNNLCIYLNGSIVYSDPYYNYIVGTSYSSGVPYLISDSTIALGYRISNPTFNTTLRNLLNEVVNQRIAVLNAMSAKAATKSTWNGTSSKPANIYNTQPSSVKNSTFTDWLDINAVPTDWVQFGNVPIKNTTIKRTGDCSVQFNCDGSEQFIYTAYSVELANSTLITGSVDLMLLSRTSGLPGILIRYLSGVTIIGETIVTAKTTDLNVWQTVPFTLRANDGGTITSIYLYMMGSWTGFGAGFIGSVVFDSFQFSIQKASDVDNKKQLMSDVSGPIDTSSTSSQLLNLSITGGKLSDLTIPGGKLANYTLGPEKFAVSQLAAITADLGTINAGNYTGNGYIDIQGSYSVSGYQASAVFNKNSTQPNGIVVYGSAIAGVFLGGGSTNNAGVLGSGSAVGVTGISNSNWGRGVEGFGSTGGYFNSTTSGYAVHIDGRILKAGTELVYNLNAERLNGKYSSDFSLTSHTHSDYMKRIYCTGGGGGYTVSTNDIQFNSSLGSYEFYTSGNNIVVFRAVSDQSLKQNIEPETLGLNFINSLNPVTYRLKSDPIYKYHGIIANEVHELVTDISDVLKITHPDGLKGTDPTSFIFILIKAVQELSAEVTLLKNQLLNN